MLNVSKRQPTFRRFVAPLLVAWLIVAAVGLGAMARWQNTPATKLPPATSWPTGMPVPRDARLANLVMVAHPKCPCSKASLNELVKLMTRVGPSACVSVLFYEPANAPREWLEDSLWEEAKGVPGIHVIADPDGKWAAELGATVSGHTFLFDSRGQLLFEGGITAGRGHEGENAGSEAIAAFLAGKHPMVTSSPTYGCGVFDRAQPLPPR
jgi:hypothetical protein